MSTLTPTPSPTVAGSQTCASRHHRSGGGRQRGAAVFRPGVFHHPGHRHYDCVSARSGGDRLREAAPAPRGGQLHGVQHRLLVLYLLGLGLYTQFSRFVDDLPSYSQRMNDIVDNVASRVDDVEKRTYQIIIPKRFQNIQPVVPAPPPETGRRRRTTNPPEPAAPPAIPEVRIHTEPTPLLTYVYGYVRSFYDVLLMASFVPFLVYFMLSWRDHMRRSFLYLFRGPERQVVGKSWEGVADMVRAYVIGNFILGLLMSFLSSLFFFSIRLPYWPLIGPLSGFLSLVPYVGLPLAMLPPWRPG